MTLHSNPLINRLLVRKSAIEQGIVSELKRPLPDATKLKQLKQLRLSLKDRVAQLSRRHPYEIEPAAVRVT